jgi:hypothetical protein
MHHHRMGTCLLRKLARLTPRLHRKEKIKKKEKRNHLHPPPRLPQLPTWAIPPSRQVGRQEPEGERVPASQADGAAALLWLAHTAASSPSVVDGDARLAGAGVAREGGDRCGSVRGLVESVASESTLSPCASNSILQPKPPLVRAAHDVKIAALPIFELTCGRSLQQIR